MAALGLWAALQGTPWVERYRGFAAFSSSILSSFPDQSGQAQSSIRLAMAISSSHSATHN